MIARGFPLTPLAAPLSATQRDSLRGALRALLLWQRDLQAWPAGFEAPDATPIVSLYANGALCGCAGVSEGAPNERVQRAFVQALGDGRFGGLGKAARAELRAQLSYPTRVEVLELENAHEQIEVGTHGLALAGRERPVTLLPDVAPDNGHDAAGMLDTLEKKGARSRSEWRQGGLFRFETETVIARQNPANELSEDALEAAAGWLARRVDADGRVTFGIEPRTAQARPLSPMYHGRSAILVRALFAQGNSRGAAVRARRWLETELKDALAGKAVAQFPKEPALIAGTLALASLCGVEQTDALRAYARHPETLVVPWHAAQVVAALGERAPSSLWQICRRNLEAEPWAPWTAIAARARGDGETLARAVRALIAAVRERGPHTGGVGPGSVPEIARTAATVEALHGIETNEARAARALARSFLLKHQIHGDRCAKTPEPLAVHGAFPQTPIHDLLQVDVTGHALMALSG
ncbi:MAG: AMMECR1 domain-containing protein [Myxococcales bacterium]